MQVLEDLLDYRTAQLYALRPSQSSTRWWSSSSTVSPPSSSEEEQALIRRLNSIGLDPRMYGFTLPALQQSADATPQPPREISWSDIFFGNKESRSSITEKWTKVTAGLRKSLFASSTISPGSHADSDHQEQEELANLQREWQTAFQTDTD